MCGIRVKIAGWCIRAALYIYPRSRQRDDLAAALDLWMTRQFDPLGLAGRKVTIHRREVK